MERGGIEDGQTSIPLLLSENPSESSDSSSPATAVVVLSTLVAVFGSYVFGSAVGYSSPAQSGIMDDLGLSVAEYSVFGSISTIGAMLGAVMSGKLADLFGRRGTMGFAEVFCIIGWLGIVLAKGAWLLDLGRFLVGYGIGLLSYVVQALEFDFYIWLLLNVTLEAEGICICNSKQVPVYIAEITPKNLRGGFTAVNQLMICIGVSITYLVGTFISWRMLALIGTIPCVLQLLGLFFIPESPRWLAKNDRWLDCEAALQRLRGQSAYISVEATEIRDYTETLQKLAAAKVLDLFQRRYAHSLVVGVGLMVLQQFGGVNGIAYYASAIFESAGFSGKVGTWAMVIVQVPMTLLGVLLMDKSGRRALLMISAAGTCLGCFLVGLSYLLQDLQVWKDFSPIMALGGVLVKRRSSIPNFSFLILESGVYGVLFIRHGRNSVGDNVRDISHKHERFGRKPCYSNQLARDLDYFIYLQLLNGLELRR
ncbi:hypothetical protein RHMOL_Rhmol07G0227600 [Rhododendron molle]|uniref:Uncharacterized protein n=1 Tax=Rhododendron molle TaxID=49168 RepID=A0ACC0N3L5_RHOML|nr:hypothetical protein RHMOL_Rhmol07G0227600 [Rhododendron molle]